jgi:hypothetical protein
MSKRIHTKRRKASFPTTRAGPLLAQWAGRYQANVRRLLHVTRVCFEIVPRIQIEVSK